MAQFHRDIDCVGKDRDAFAMANAARNLGSGSASADGYDVAVVYQAGGFESYLPLFSLAFLFLFLKGRDVPERLIQHWRNGDGAAVIASQQSLSFQVAQVSANGHGRYAEPVREVFDRDLSVTEQFLQYRFPSATRC